MKTARIYCNAGQHWWERPSQRGRRPHSCPNHSAIPDIVSSIHAQANAEERKLGGPSIGTRLDHELAERISSSRVRRVQAFKVWLRKGSPCETIPEIPSDYDYSVARQVGAI